VQQRVFLFFVTSKHNSEQRVIGQSWLPLRPLIEHILTTYPTYDIRSEFYMQTPIKFEGYIEHEGIKVGSV
jgi:hypothetical protein